MYAMTLPDSGAIGPPPSLLRKSLSPRATDELECAAPEHLVPPPATRPLPPHIMHSHSEGIDSLSGTYLSDTSDGHDLLPRSSSSSPRLPEPAPSPVDSLGLGDEEECIQREPACPPHMELEFTRDGGAVLHDPMHHKHSHEQLDRFEGEPGRGEHEQAGAAAAAGQCVELESLAGEVLSTQSLSQLTRMHMPDYYSPLPSSYDEETASGASSSTVTLAALSSGSSGSRGTSPNRAATQRHTRMHLPHFSPLPLDPSFSAAAGPSPLPSYGASPLSSLSPSLSGTFTASASASALSSSSSSVATPAMDHLPMEVERRDQVRAAVHAIQVAGEAATAAAMASTAAAAVAAAAAAASSSSTPTSGGIAMLEEGSVGAIGDVSSSTATLSSTLVPNYWMIAEELEEIRMHGEHDTPAAATGSAAQGSGGGGRKQSRRASVGSHNHHQFSLVNNSTAASAATARRRSGSLSGFISGRADGQPLPSQQQQPIVRSQRILARRNSEAAAAAATSQSLPVTPRSSGVKRKQAGGSGSGSGSSGSSSSMSEVSTPPSRADCPSCAHCADCTRHWSSMDAAAAGATHDPEHGHVHSRGDSWSHGASSTARLPAPPPPSDPHPPPPLHLRLPAHSTGGGVGRNHHGVVLKPNHAIRTSESLSDAPERLSLALSPALHFRRLHHSMVHGRSYEVACILDMRERSGIVEYLVGWAGYPDLFNSWEPVEGLMEACTGLVHEFEERQRIEEGVTMEDEDEEEEDEEDERQLEGARDGGISSGQVEGHPERAERSRPVPTDTTATAADDDELDDPELTAVHQQALAAAEQRRTRNNADLQPHTQRADANMHAQPAQALAS